MVTAWSVVSVSDIQNYALTERELLNIRNITLDECALRRNMSLSKLVQNDYAHEGKPTFAKTRHGPLVMVNNHSTQVFEQHLAMGIRCKTPV